MNKTLSLSLAVLVFIIVLGSYVSALDDRIIKSASELGYPPFSVVTEDGEADGFSVELLRATLNSQGYDVSFYTGPWEQVKQDLADGKIQVLPLVGRTPEREPRYNFTKPYISLFGTIFVREGDTRIKTVDDLVDKEVLVLKGDNAEEYANREKISDNIITTETYDEAFQLLSNGKHDAIIAQDLLGYKIIKKLGIENVVALDYRINEFRQDFTFAVKEGDPDNLLPILNQGLEEVIIDGTFDKLFEKWFSSEEKTKFNNIILIVSAVVLVLIGLLIWYLIKKDKKKKSWKLFICVVICLVLIFYVLMLLFGNFAGKFTGFAVQEEFSRPAEPLFDISVYLEYNTIEAGEKQIITTKIINQGIDEAEDVLVIYTLWDRDKEHKISESSESVAVQTTLSLVKQVYIPENLPSGDYVIKVEVQYSGKQASADASFTIKGIESSFNYEWIIIGIGIFISIILLYIVYLLRRSKNK